MSAPTSTQTALKYGLYARQFTPEQIAFLDLDPSIDLAYEIDLMNILRSELLELRPEFVERLLVAPDDPDFLKDLARLDLSLALSEAVCQEYLFAHACPACASTVGALEP